MDTRILIALGMLLATALAGVMKGVLSGADLKEVLILVGGGIMGNAIPRRTVDTAPAPAPRPPIPAGAVALLVAATLLLVSCATAKPPRCNPVMVQCHPAEHPPITTILPPWPFPRLIPPGGSQP